MCGDSPTGELTRSFKKLIWSASVILIGDSWCFDISIQDKRDVIDLPSKSSQDYTSRDSNYYQLWQQESEGKWGWINLLYWNFILDAGANI